MSSSAITTQVAQLKIGNVQNQADNSAVYSGGVWSLKNSTALTSVTIDNSGNVGIGTASPGQKLHVNGGIIRIDNTNILFLNPNYDNGNSIAIQGFSNVPLVFATNNTERMRITASGAFSFQSTTQTSDKAFLIKNFGETGNGRNSVTLDSGNAGSNSSIIAFNKNNGNLWNVFNDTPANNSTDFAIWSSSTGGVTLGSNTATSWSPRSSDERKKKNFETTQGLEEVLQIEPVKYHFKSEEDSEPKRLGFKAQNLQTVVPEMVFSTGEKAEDGSDYLTITPDYLLPVLVKAIQEQQAQIEALKAEVAALKAP